ncbi:MAG: ribosome biogenesis GTPase Der [bacterium]
MREYRVSIIGRVNVGKSTLFNRLTRSRDALVLNLPGVTRDRKESHFLLFGHTIVLVDTGGIEAGSTTGDKAADEAQKQSLLALNDSDLLLFVVDGRSELLPGDFEIAQKIRKSNKPVILVVNKMEGNIDSLTETLDIYRLGLGEPIFISAEHNINIDLLLENLSESLNLGTYDGQSDLKSTETETRIAVVGRPNVGKSSFVNAILGEYRHIVTDIPGTTRDSVDSVFKYYGVHYRLIDTAGLRRIGKTTEKLDKLSAMKARRSIERCHIALLLLDAVDGVTAQDLKIARYVVDEGKGCIIIANKWDLTDRTTERFKLIQQSIREHFVAMPWAPFMAMSAMEQHNTRKVFTIVNSMMKSTQAPVSTSRLNKAIQDAQRIHPPAVKQSKHPVKLYYATQIGLRPPTFLCFTNTRHEIHFSYRRFLSNQIREAFSFDGWPIRLVFRHRHDERGQRWD